MAAEFRERKPSLLAAILNQPFEKDIKPGKLLESNEIPARPMEVYVPPLSRTHNGNYLLPGSSQEVSDILITILDSDSRIVRLKSVFNSPEFKDLQSINLKDLKWPELIWYRDVLIWTDHIAKVFDSSPVSTSLESTEKFSLTECNVFRVRLLAERWFFIRSHSLCVAGDQVNTKFAVTYHHIISECIKPRQLKGTASNALLSHVEKKLLPASTSQMIQPFDASNVYSMSGGMNAGTVGSSMVMQQHPNLRASYMGTGLQQPMVNGATPQRPYLRPQHHHHHHHMPGNHQVQPGYGYQQAMHHHHHETASHYPQQQQPIQTNRYHQGNGIDPSPPSYMANHHMSRHASQPCQQPQQPGGNYYNPGMMTQQPSQQQQLPLYGSLGHSMSNGGQVKGMFDSTTAWMDQTSASQMQQMPFSGTMSSPSLTWNSSLSQHSGHVGTMMPRSGSGQMVSMPTNPNFGHSGYTGQTMPSQQQITRGDELSTCPSTTNRNAQQFPWSQQQIKQPIQLQQQLNTCQAQLPPQGQGLIGSLTGPNVHAGPQQGANQNGPVSMSLGQTVSSASDSKAWLNCLDRQSSITTSSEFTTLPPYTAPWEDEPRHPQQLPPEARDKILRLHEMHLTKAELAPRIRDLLVEYIGPENFTRSCQHYMERGNTCPDQTPPPPPAYPSGDQDRQSTLRQTSDVQSPEEGPGSSPQEDQIVQSTTNTEEDQLRLMTNECKSSRKCYPADCQVLEALLSEPDQEASQTPKSLVKQRWAPGGSKSRSMSDLASLPATPTTGPHLEDEVRTRTKEQHLSGDRDTSGNNSLLIKLLYENTDTTVSGNSKQGAMDASGCSAVSSSQSPSSPPSGGRGSAPACSDQSTNLVRGSAPPCTDQSTHLMRGSAPACTDQNTHLVRAQMPHSNCALMNSSQLKTGNASPSSRPTSHEPMVSAVLDLMCSEDVRREERGHKRRSSCLSDLLEEPKRLRHSSSKNAGSGSKILAQLLSTNTASDADEEDNQSYGEVSQEAFKRPAEQLRSSLAAHPSIAILKDNPMESDLDLYDIDLDNLFSPGGEEGKDMLFVADQNRGGSNSDEDILADLQRLLDDDGDVGLAHSTTDLAGEVVSARRTSVEENFAVLNQVLCAEEAKGRVGRSDMDQSGEMTQASSTTQSENDLATLEVNRIQRELEMDVGSMDNHHQMAQQKLGIPRRESVNSLGSQCQQNGLSWTGIQRQVAMDNATETISKDYYNNLTRRMKEVGPNVNVGDHPNLVLSPPACLPRQQSMLRAPGMQQGVQRQCHPSLIRARVQKWPQQPVVETTRRVGRPPGPGNLNRASFNEEMQRRLPAPSQNIPMVDCVQAGSQPPNSRFVKAELRQMVTNRAVGGHSGVLTSYQHQHHFSPNAMHSHEQYVPVGGRQNSLENLRSIGNTAQTNQKLLGESGRMSSSGPMLNSLLVSSPNSQRRHTDQDSESALPEDIANTLLDLESMIAHSSTNTAQNSPTSSGSTGYLGPAQSSSSPIQSCSSYMSPSLVGPSVDSRGNCQPVSDSSKSGLLNALLGT